jgi:hypothetical protein
MEMCKQYQINSIVNGLRRFIKTTEVGVSPLIGVEHVDTSVENDLFVLNLNEDTRAPDLAACPQTEDFDSLALRLHRFRAIYR